MEEYLYRRREDSLARSPLSAVHVRRRQQRHHHHNRPPLPPSLPFPPPSSPPPLIPACAILFRRPHGEKISDWPADQSRGAEDKDRAEADAADGAEWLNEHREETGAAI